MFFKCSSWGRVNNFWWTIKDYYLENPKTALSIWTGKKTALFWVFHIYFTSDIFLIFLFSYVEQCVNHSVDSISLPIILFIAFLYNIPRVVISDTMSCSLTWPELFICLIYVSDNERQLLHQVCVFRTIIVIVSLLMKKQPIMCHIKHHPLFANYYLLYSAETGVLPLFIFIVLVKQILMCISV